MSIAAEPFVRQPSRTAGASLRSLPLVLATGVLWAYVASVFVYKTWYIAAAIALTIVTFLVAAGAIRTRGLLRSIWPIGLYFLVLLAGVAWAAFPRLTLLYLAIDSIEIVVFILFFLAARNSAPRSISTAFGTFLVPALAVSLVMLRLNPTVSRLGHYALMLLPLAIPFVLSTATTKPRRRFALIVVVSTFAFLLAARSRTPLAAAGIGLVLSLIVFRRNVFEFLRRAFVVAALSGVLIGILLAVRQTRPMIVTTFVRLSNISVEWGEVIVIAERGDPVRDQINALTSTLTKEHFPLGIGYMNFIGYYANLYGYEATLHSMYTTWLTEGGLACVAVVLFIGWRHMSGLRAAIRHAPTREARSFAQACLIATLGIMLAGAFHQLHASPALWLLLAFGAAAKCEVDEHRPRRSRVHARA